MQPRTQKKCVHENRSLAQKIWAPFLIFTSKSWGRYPRFFLMEEEAWKKWGLQNGMFLSPVVARKTWIFSVPSTTRHNHYFILRRWSSMSHFRGLKRPKMMVLSTGEHDPPKACPGYLEDSVTLDVWVPQKPVRFPKSLSDDRTFRWAFQSSSF